jgi:hypothetical protein
MRWAAWLLRLVLVALGIVQLALGNPSGALVALEGLLVSLLPRLVAWRSARPFPPTIELLFVFGMTLQFASESLKLFEYLTYWDKIVHPTLVALTAWLAAWLLLGYRDRYRRRLPIHLVAALGLLLGITVGGAWEYVEFASDWFADADLQKSNADTMTDLVANNAGAFVALILSLRLYPRWLSAEERNHTGELAQWLALGPTKVLERHGHLLGGAFAAGVAGVLIAAQAIDRDWPPLPPDAPAGGNLASNAAAAAPASFAVLAGDWSVDPDLGLCRADPAHPKPGSERPGLVQLAPGSVYGRDDRLFEVQASVFEQRPPLTEGTQMDGGVAFGIRDANNFYLLEQSALHDVLRLDRYVHGRRRDVHERLVRTRGNEWHTVRVRVEGERVTAAVDGQDVFSVDGVAEPAGGIGLWARTAAATCFGDAQVEVQ